MQLTPRYDGPPLLRIDVDLPDPVEPMVRQRRRLAATLAGLDEAQWATPSRCEGWTVQDVVAHLSGTNPFWTFSISAGLRREPTRVLASFDPVATPAQMVDGLSSMTPAEVLARYVASLDQLEAVVADVGPEQRATVAEAPPGHVPLDAVVLHALWDAWIHERDILLPLGLQPVEEPDEVAACLLYAATLGPMFLAASGEEATGSLAIATGDPDVVVVIDHGVTVVVRSGDAPEGTATLRGPSAAVVEALSFRGPFPHPLAADDEWLLGGLGVVFDVAG